MLKKFATLIALLMALSLAVGSALPALAAPVRPVDVLMGQEGGDLEAQVADMLANIPEGWGVIRPQGLMDLLIEEPPFLLDVRQPEELEENGYIEGSVHIPLRELAQHLDLLPADFDMPIVVYCGSGIRSAYAMTALMMMGYADVKSLAGGFRAWIEAEMPVEEGMPEAPEGGEGPEVDPALVEALDAALQGIPEGWGIIRPQGLMDLLIEEPPVLVDVRQPEELAENGLIEGAINAPLRELAEYLDQIPQDQTVVVYCAAGHRGAIGAMALRILGYEDVLNLAGGFNGWVAADLPIVMPEGAEEGEGEAEEAAGMIDLTAYLSDYLHNMLPEGWGVIRPQGLMDLLIEEPPFLLDVRQPEELEENGYIEGAVNIPLRELAQHLDLLPADLNAPIVVYCGTGFRSAYAMTALQILGYADVKSLAGGLRAWNEEGLPVSTEPMPEPEVIGPAEIMPALVTAVDQALNSIPEGWGAIRPQGLMDLLIEEPPFLLDVRQPEELAENGMIEGAVNIPLRELADNLDQLPQEFDAAIVIYCGSGHRGNIAALVLRTLGYENVQNLAGGFNAWVNEGMPVVMPEAAE